MHISEGKKITIHYCSFGPCTEKEFQMSDITISLFYLSKEIIDREKEWYPKNHFKNMGYENEGYIIEAKIKAVVKQKVKYIEKEYFENIYEEFDKIDFKKLAIEGDDGCDGGKTEVEMGVYNGFNQYIKKVSLWCPHVYDNETQSDLFKFLNLIKKIKNEINFDEWYNNLYTEWQKWENKIEKYNKLFQYNNKNM